MTAPALEVQGLTARFGDLEILRGVDLVVPFGEVHALMGPNGSGKSTLCHVLMGKPGYQAAGSARVGGQDLLGRDVDERARIGLFEGFQYPVEVPGVALRRLLEEMALVGGEAIAARAVATAQRLDLERFLDRPVNTGLSGGEKKKSEMLQLGALAPKVAVLDEIDSGLDIDAVREVAETVEAMRSPDLGVLVITHYSRILRYLTVDRVHVMVAGRIVQSGDAGLAEDLEGSGYDLLVAEYGPPADTGVSEHFLDGL